MEAAGEKAPALESQPGVSGSPCHPELCDLRAGTPLGGVPPVQELGGGPRQGGWGLSLVAILRVQGLVAWPWPPALQAPCGQTPLGWAVAGSGLGWPWFESA